jgi:malate dehydrogenase
MANIGIIGSGNVGANTAFFLAEKHVAHVVLYDVQEGLSTGKALDMMEAAPIRDYQTKITGTDTIDDLLDSQVVIITAGGVRKPGMNREDLFEANREVISGIASKMRNYRGVVIMVTEPVDYLTTLFLAESSLPSTKVLGLGGFLDSTRLRYLIAKELRVSMENVCALVIGRHSDAMIPLADYCKVSGIPVATLIEEKRLTAIFEETRRAGGLIVDLAERASAYYGPSAVASELSSAIIHDTRRICSVSIEYTGQYGISGVAMSLPAIIGREGAVRVLEPKLTDSQKRVLADSAATISRAVKTQGGKE